MTVSGYQINRYITGYDGIVKMLSSVGAKLHVTFQNGKVVLSAEKKHDYSKDDDFDSDLVDFDIKKQFNLCSVSRKNLIPDLTGMDLNDDAVVDRLYTEQEEFLKKCRAEASSRSLSCYHKMKDKVADLEAENERLRQELEVAKSNRKK